MNEIRKISGETREMRKPSEEYIAKLVEGDFAGALVLARAYDWDRPIICYHTSFFIDKLVSEGNRQRAAQVAAAIGNDTNAYLFNRLKKE